MPTVPAMTTNPIDTIDIGADFSIVPRGTYYNDSVAAVVCFAC